MLEHQRRRTTAGSSSHCKGKREKNYPTHGGKSEGWKPAFFKPFELTRNRCYGPLKGFDINMILIASSATSEP